MGSSEYLMKVQNLNNTEIAGISQPQTLAQKLRYELEVEQEQELDALQDKLGKLYSSIEGGGECAKYLTYNVLNSKTYKKDEPKLITMEASRKLYLESTDQMKLLQFQGSSEQTDDDSRHKKDSEKPGGKVICGDLNEID